VRQNAETNKKGQSSDQRHAARRLQKIIGYIIIHLGGKQAGVQ
jgi:stalled ribosome alternative rescue factor ArfA